MVWHRLYWLLINNYSSLNLYFLKIYYYFFCVWIKLTWSVKVQFELILKLNSLSSIIRTISSSIHFSLNLLFLIKRRNDSGSGFCWIKYSSCYRTWFVPSSNLSSLYFLLFSYFWTSVDLKIGWAGNKSVVDSVTGKLRLLWCPWLNLFPATGQKLVDFLTANVVYWRTAFFPSSNFYAIIYMNLCSSDLFMDISEIFLVHFFISECVYLKTFSFVLLFSC